MRLPKFSLRFLFYLIVVVCVFVRWYFQPTLMEQVCAELPSAEGRGVERVLRKIPRLSFDERSSIFTYSGPVSLNVAAQQRLERAAYDWAKRSPDEIPLWLHAVFLDLQNDHGNPPEDWPNAIPFYGTDPGYPIVRGMVRGLCEVDPRMAYRMLDHDSFEWDEFYEVKPTGDFVVEGLAALEFEEIVTFMRTTDDALFRRRYIDSLGEILLEKDYEAFVLLLPKTIGKCGLRWVDHVDLQKFCERDYRRACSVLVAAKTKNLNDLAEPWVRDDHRGYARWADEVPDRINFLGAATTWPTDDFAFLHAWLQKRLKYDVAGFGRSYLAERATLAEVVQFSDDLLRSAHLSGSEYYQCELLQAVLLRLIEFDCSLAHAKFEQIVDPTLRRVFSEADSYREVYEQLGNVRKAS